MSGVIVTLRGNLRLSIGLAERQDRVEDDGRARYQCSEPGAYPHPPSADRLEPQVCTVDDAAKRSAERKLTNEARTEGKLACPLPCKEEEDEVNDRSSRVCGVSARPVSLTRHSPADKSVIRSGRRRSGTAHRHRGLGRAFLTLESMAMPQAAPTATERSEVCYRYGACPLGSLSRRARMNVMDECAMGLAASIPPSVARTLGLIEERASNRA